MMRSRWGLLGVVGVLALAGDAFAQGMLVPVDRSVRPLPIVYQRVNATVRDQAAETRIEQEFRNETSRPLEAYYLFPLPDGAAVKDFAMTVDGKRVKGELVEANRARQVYEDIVRRTQDPGLLEHMGKNLWRVRVFPVPPQGRQKFELTYTEIVPLDANICTYTYPLKSANDAVRTEQDFTIRCEVKGTAAIKSIYSPTHHISVSRDGDHKATVGFEERNFLLNRDFQLYWTQSDADVGLSLLAHRESQGEPGYFMLLVSPKIDMPREARVPRDIVFVIDTSGSMREDKMEQARKALEFCLKSLDKSDRFGLISFATTVNKYAREFKTVNDDTIKPAVEWVRNLSAGGGTAIGEALDEALKMRTGDARNFTIVFMTDGQPTIGETDPNVILKQVQQKNTAQTRIFTCGIGDDVNTHLLDQIGDQTRAVSVYVRPKEDIEAKVSNFYNKIRHPVLANLSLELEGDGKRISDIYPPKLPDLFHGGQLVALGRFTGRGDATIKLKGKVGQTDKEFIYRVHLPDEKRDADFLPSLWARRKIGYLLDQIRLKGENKELVEEVVFLAKRHGIATPYTSWLIAPDQRPLAGGGFQPPTPNVRFGAMRDGVHSNDWSNRGGDNLAKRDYRLGEREGGQISGPGPGARPTPSYFGGERGGSGGGGSADAYKLFSRLETKTTTPPAGTPPAAAADGRDKVAKVELSRGGVGGIDPAARPLEESVKESRSREAGVKRRTGNELDEAGKPVTEAEDLYDRALEQLRGGQAQGRQNQEAGEQAVDLAIALRKLKTVAANPTKFVVQTRGKSSFVDIGGGIWVDQKYKEGGKVVKVKYLSAAYFRILEKVAAAKVVLSLGNRLVWITPSGAALVIDETGKDKLTDAEIQALFPPGK